MIESVLHPYNLQRALRQVIVNKGSSGVDGKRTKRRKGVPQGSPISPLLSNILLNELDKELTRLKLRFVRYADDFSIYVQSKSKATATMHYIVKFLKTKLKLTINEQKSGIRRPVQFT